MLSIRAADLLFQDHFQIPHDAPDGSLRSRKAHVVEVGPSRMLEKHTRVVTTSRRGNRAVLVLPDDMTVWLIERVAVSDVKVAKCTCRNHLGKKKIAYKSREAAVAGIMHHHIRHGEHRIYPCPTEEGRFHITSKKERVHRPNG